jgi:diadenosine tetraphosphatase ApaH/serine/threonine PP2A family protein phosphatase
MSISCPVCYENFVSEENHQHSCRKLPCGDLICRSCMTSEIFENTYYCPECGRDFNGSSVDEFSEFIADPLLMESSPNSPTASSSNIFSDTTSPISPNDSYSRENRRVSVRMPCIEPGCKNKAIAAGLCMYHASAGAHNSPGMTSKAVVHESKLAKNMAENSGLTDIIMSRGRFESRNQQFSIHPDDIIRRFKNQQRIELGEAMEILNSARNILSREPNILRIDAPVIAVGDIHGQFYDLLNLLEEGGQPSESSTPFLFLGDYVDRGSFSCEVIFTLLALKIAYPDKIYLLRGNHECGSVSSHFGFKQECKRKYGVNVYHRALLVFQTMPIASIISTAFGDIYACHGGLSPTLKTLEEIEALDRFVEPEQNSGLLDILWSDPISENAIDDLPDDIFEEFLKVNWKPNPARGCSYCFGYAAIKEFLNKNGLVCIVRAHEVQADGFRRHFEPRVVENRLRNLLMHRVSEINENEVFKRPAMKRRPSVAEAEAMLKTELITEKDFPPVITIFSAPNYCDRYGNKAAILHIDSALDGFRVIQYDCVEHPVPDISDSQTENYMDAIIVACPYMPSSFRDFVKMALQLGPDESLVGELEHFHKMSKSSMSSTELEPVEQATVSSDDHDHDSGVQHQEPVPEVAEDDEIVIATAKEPKTPVGRMSKRKSLTINIFSGDNVDSGPSSEVRISGGFKEDPHAKVTKEESVRHLLLDEDIDAELSPLYRDSTELRRKSASDTLKKSSSIKKVTYMQALASDSINEVHPEALTSFIQGAMNQKFFGGDEQDRAIQFQVRPSALFHPRCDE